MVKYKFVMFNQILPVTLRHPLKYQVRGLVAIYLKWNDKTTCLNLMTFVAGVSSVIIRGYNVVYFSTNSLIHLFRFIKCSIFSDNVSVGTNDPTLCK